MQTMINFLVWLSKFESPSHKRMCELYGSVGND